MFDCRALPNPGRLTEYKMLTGLQNPVVDYLEKHKEIEDFYAEAYTLVRRSIEIYQNRGFQHISVSFGCTGGQHRSVYMANRLAKAIEKYANLRVKLNHRKHNG